MPVIKPGLIRVNQEVANLLGIDPEWLASEEGIKVIAGNLVPDGAAPIATVYAGHQFGGWNPQLGDGRAVLLGEVIGKDGDIIGFCTSVKLLSRKVNMGYRCWAAG